MRTKLQKYFGFSDFQPLQEEIITDVVNHKDVLVLMPTGGGKSLCYQLPAILKNGVTVVVSPLISLMKDQVDGLKAAGISAASINSSLDYKKVFEIKSQLKNNNIKLLYVAPERIVLQGFFEFLSGLDISLFAIDEAHCISEWGHDFRPEYRNLNLLKSEFPSIPVIALTSTAIPQVQDDIVGQLGMKSPRIYKASLNRKNLFYQIVPSKKDMYGKVVRYLKERQNDSGIIYCQSRKSVDGLAVKLQREGFRALPYHAGLTNKLRTEYQNKFIEDEINIIVATIAFGMGIDKSNVRYVIHCDMPKNIEAYYQETGRAGRDGLKSDCILFYSYGDKIKQEYFIRQIGNEQYRTVAYKKMWDIIGYCKSQRCRRISMLRYFGEEYNQDRCGMCDVCVTEEELPVDLTQPTEIITKRVRKKIKSDYGAGDRKLFEVLRKLRKEIADKENMPPYIVFSDVALKDMAVKLPKDMEGFIEINGVGEVKLQKYGKVFTDKIIEYCKDSSGKAGKDDFDNTENKSYSVDELRKNYSKAYAKWEAEDDESLISGFNNGKDIEELAEMFGRREGAIRSRLAKLGIDI